MLIGQLLKHLSLSGPAKAKDLCEVLSVSQPTFSRLLRQREASPILRLGRGRQTLYALKRFGPWGKTDIPVCSLDEEGTISLVATLYPLLPKGFYLESHTENLTTLLYEGLPYLFEDLRPSGFLGRLIPRLSPQLEFPGDINTWNDDHALLYLTRCGWDLIGNYLIGESSEEAYLTHRFQETDVISEGDREKVYPKLAQLVLSTGIPGSSAGGEQPKFLAILRKKDGFHSVIVKFSPPLQDAVSQRIADLLICEHLAHGVLRKHGKRSLASRLVRVEDRLFLEAERFDRTLQGGRRGVISLRTLDLEFVGELKSWSDTAEALFRQHKIDHTNLKEIIWLEVFGKLIGNSDRHHGNISLFCEGENVLGLAPVYDMLPMMYAPQQHQLIERTFEPPLPKPSELSMWNDAAHAARDFWAQAQQHPQISSEFKSVIVENESKITHLLQKL